MRRIMLRVSYDGTQYSGWQLQENGRTIEGELNRVLYNVTGENIRVTGASRTDAGVHAEDAVCVFDTESRIPPEKFPYAMNTGLPFDIRVWKSEEVDTEFHPRKCISEKTYEYRIWNDTFNNPLITRYAHFSYRRLDIDAMNRAAARLVGKHDFKAFCAAGSTAETTVREIVSLRIKRAMDEPRLIKITVTGRGFLYNMVRIISGTLLEVGTGSRSEESVGEALRLCERSAAGPTAPARGLTLKKTEFIESI